MLKPEIVARGLVGRILQRIENRGFSIAGLKILKLTQEQATELYKIHEKKTFFNDLISYITSGSVIIMVVEGPKVIEAMRKLSGSTSPFEAEAGSIRGTYGLTVTKNAIHTADGYENAKREINLFFRPEEILVY
jgi:nucleoside-diphosphate kinase